MASRYEEIRNELIGRPRRWLVTGAAGFIGSHLVEGLLDLNQQVTGLDNLATGQMENLHDVRLRVGDAAWKNFRFLGADIRDMTACRDACAGAEFVLHQAALGSVPRSLAKPLETHAVNVDGFLNVLWAAKDAACRKFVFASSSSVYGDHEGLPKVEDRIGEPLSPYAASKLCGEICARTFQASYGVPTVGLRYFNVFGPRQDPGGPYAAVIPRWIHALQSGEQPVIYGDGETSRDFCPVANVVEANILAAMAPPEVSGREFNIALGGRLSLNQLLAAIQEAFSELRPGLVMQQAEFADFREGDVLHSQADIRRACEEIGFAPSLSVKAGLRLTLEWHLQQEAGTPDHCR